MRRALLRLLLAALYLVSAQSAYAEMVINPFQLSTPASVVFTDASHLDTNVTSYSFATQALGTADPTRVIHVAAVGRTTAGVDITDINVGASDCPLIAPNLATADNDFATCAVAFPTGTTDTIVVTTSANMSRLAITVWASYNLISIVPTDRATATGDPSSTTAVDFQAGGIGMALAATGATGTMTWAELTEGAGCDAVSESATNYGCASKDYAAAATGPTISADYTGGDTGAGMIVEAFR